MVLKKILMVITSVASVAALLSVSGCAAQSGSTLGGGSLAQRMTQLENRVSQLKLQRDQLAVINEGINFDINSDSLSPAAKKMIDQFLATVPNYRHARYFVAGYTDSAGPAKLNYQLGLRRSNSVARYLILNKTIDPSHVTTGSHGHGDPFAANKNRLGRLLNRHVDIIAFREVIR